MKKLIVLLLLIGVVFAADFNISTTSDFELGVKSNSSGNFEIETYLDNFNISEGSFSLANGYSDRFTFPDADGENWKFNIYDSVTAVVESANISSTYSGKFYMNVSGVSSGSDYVIVHDFALTGDYDVRVNFSELNLPNTNVGLAGFMTSRSKTSFVDLHVISRMYNGGQMYYGASDYSSFTDTVASTDTSGMFRLVREINASDCNFTSMYWNSGWQTLHTHVYDLAGNSWCDDDYYVFFDIYSVTGRPNVSIVYDDFQVYSGELSGSHRTSGNWTSALQSAPPNQERLDNITLIYSEVNATNYIDKVEVLNSSDEVVATYDTNIDSGSSITITEQSLTSGSINSIVDSVFKIRIFLVGTGSPVVEEISGEFGTDWNDQGTVYIISAPGLSLIWVLGIFLTAVVIMFVIIRIRD